MLNVSATYTSILSGPHWSETALVMTDTNGNTHSVYERSLFSVTITDGVCENGFAIGNAVSAEVDIEMVEPTAWTPKTMGKIGVWYRLCNETQKSEWVSKGVFWIDTREKTKSMGDENVLRIHGYDIMMRAEQAYPAVNWNTRSDYNVVKDICVYLNVNLDQETDTFFRTTRAGYTLPTPYNYTIREVLRSIATANAGNFVISEAGRLRLVRMNALPAETYYLITPNTDQIITIGGNRIVLL